MIRPNTPIRCEVPAHGAGIASAGVTVRFAAPADTFSGDVLNGEAADHGRIVGRTAAGTVTISGSEALSGTVPLAMTSTRRPR